jgi:predicted metal-dependent hydrolase
VRRRTLGSYSSHTNIIRINPVLDKRSVPPYFIEFIIYHEMLHADLGVETGENRRSVHTREFRRREKMFKKYAEALAWEKDMNSSM